MGGTAQLQGPEFLIVGTWVDFAPATTHRSDFGYWNRLLVREAAETLRAAGATPFAAYCSDPCDGRTQGTTGMFDSLPYRNDAATVMRRLIRSLPTANGVMGVATCDKGLPATMLALAGSRGLPGVIVPGGVTLPAAGAEDAGQVQSIGARFSRDLVTLDYAAEMGCRACGSSGGGCQFLGTAATSQVVAEAFGLALPHSALAPSGEPSWLELGRRSARAHAPSRTVTSTDSHAARLENAMLVRTAFELDDLHCTSGDRTRRGLTPPTVRDGFASTSRRRLVDALPADRAATPHCRYMAGGVPEVMLHLRRMVSCTATSSQRRATRSTRRSTGGRRATAVARRGRDSPRARRSIQTTW